MGKEETYSSELYAIVLDIQHCILPLEGLTERTTRLEEAVEDLQKGLRELIRENTKLNAQIDKGKEKVAENSVGQTRGHKNEELVDLFVKKNEMKKKKGSKHKEEKDKQFSSQEIESSNKEKSKKCVRPPILLKYNGGVKGDCLCSGKCSFNN